MTKIDHVRNIISDGLESVKVREHLSNKSIGTAYGIGAKGVGRIINGEDVKLNFNQVIELMLLAGLKIERGSK